MAFNIGSTNSTSGPSATPHILELAFTRPVTETELHYIRCDTGSGRSIVGATLHYTV